MTTFRLQKEIEYFENRQLKALLAASPGDTKTGRRNRITLILGYDAGLRVSELMGKTVNHIKAYLKEFHPVLKMDIPLFYATTKGHWTSTRQTVHYPISSSYWGMKIS